MESGSKLSGPDDFDKYISTELPDEKKYPLLHELVCKHMMHGPCGVLNKSVVACKMVHVVLGTLNNSVRPLNRERMHILYTEEEMLVTKFLCVRNGWIIDGLYHIIQHS